MARFFNGTTDYLGKTISAVPLMFQYLAVHAWIKPYIALPPADMTICELIDNTHNFRMALIIEGSAGPPDRGKVRWVVSTPAGSNRAQTSTYVVANHWQHVCGQELNFFSNREAFLDGGGKGTNGVAVGQFGIHEIYVGRSFRGGAPANWFFGEIGHVCLHANIPMVTTKVFDDRDILSIAKGLVNSEQLRLGTQIAYFPLNGRAPEPNVINPSMTLNLFGTPPPPTPEPNGLRRRVLAP